MDLRELLNRTRAGKFAVLLVATRPPPDTPLGLPDYLLERASVTNELRPHGSEVGSRLHRLEHAKGLK